MEIISQNRPKLLQQQRSVQGRITYKTANIESVQSLVVSYLQSNILPSRLYDDKNSVYSEQTQESAISMDNTDKDIDQSTVHKCSVEENNSDKKTMNKKNTAESVELAQRFNDEALPLIHQLFGAAMKMTQNPSDAEDLVQETYAKAFVNFSSFTQGTNIRAWLYKILTNTYINIYRQKQRRPQQVHSEQITDWQLTAAAEHSPTGLKSAEIEALELLPDPEINQALQALPEEYRMAVFYADVEGLPYKDIAEIMETPVGTVMSRLHRGRTQLKKELLGVALERGIIHSRENKSRV